MSSYQTPTYPSWDNVPNPYTQYPAGTSYPQQYPTGTPFPQMPGYTPTPTYPQMPPISYPGPGAPTLESSYIENILRLNLGKVATVYMNFENSQWGSKIFKGILRAAGKDHIIIVDPDTGIHYLLLTIYLDYITFDVPITYEYPFAGPQGPSGTMPPIYPMPTPTPTPTPTPVPPTTTPTTPPIQPQSMPYTQLRKKDNKD